MCRSFGGICRRGPARWWSLLVFAELVAADCAGLIGFGGVRRLRIVSNQYSNSF